MIENIHKDIQTNLKKYNHELVNMKPQEMLIWGYEKFDDQFAITTSFGIQSSVLLNMVSKLCLQKKIKIFWVDTGYLAPETYHYAEKLIEDLSLEVEVLQSELSPARMEAKYWKLCETNIETDLDKYDELRKIQTLENGQEKYNMNCCASGVRSSQTENRNKMKWLELIRQSRSLRQIIN